MCDDVKFILTKSNAFPIHGPLVLLVFINCHPLTQSEMVHTQQVS